MKLGIMQSYFFPYIGYFQAISAVDTYMLYENVTFRKRSWMSRNRLLEKNRGPVYFNVPTIDSDSFQPSFSVKIDNSRNWRKKTLDTIQFNYAKSRFYDEVHPLVTSLIQTDTDSLHEYNAAAVKGICEFLDIRTKILSDNSRFLSLEEKLTELRPDHYAGFEEFAADAIPKMVIRVILLCRAENADVFLSAAGGTSLYSKQVLQKFGITLYFIRTEDYRYEQGGKEFAKDLSIIDVLYNLGQEGTKKLLTKHSLV